MISLQDKHDADRLLQQAYEAGEFDKEEPQGRRGGVYAAALPRACGRRAATARLARAGRQGRDRRSIRLQPAIVAFAVVIMMFVVLGTIIANQGARSTPRAPLGVGQRLAALELR